MWETFFQNQPFFFGNFLDISKEAAIFAQKPLQYYSVKLE